MIDVGINLFDMSVSIAVVIAVSDCHSVFSDYNGGLGAELVETAAEAGVAVGTGAGWIFDVMAASSQSYLPDLPCSVIVNY